MKNLIIITTILILGINSVSVFAQTKTQKEIIIITLLDSVGVNCSIEELFSYGFEETKDGEFLLNEPPRIILLTPVKENIYLLTKSIQNLDIAKYLAQDFIMGYINKNN